MNQASMLNWAKPLLFLKTRLIRTRSAHGAAEVSDRVESSKWPKRNQLIIAQECFILPIHSSFVPTRLFGSSPSDDPTKDGFRNELMRPTQDSRPRRISLTLFGYNAEMHYRFPPLTTHRSSMTWKDGALVILWSTGLWSRKRHSDSNIWTEDPWHYFDLRPHWVSLLKFSYEYKCSDNWGIMKA